MFAIKICGVTREDDARQIAVAGADAIGLNFVPSSPRFLSEERAQRIRAAIPAGLATVGVFVDAAASHLRDACERFRFTHLQFHGDEPPTLAGEFPAETVIKAFRCGEAGLDPVWRYLEECDRLGIRLAGVLLDAYAPGAYGGTGRVVDWELVAAERSRFGTVPLILAGGLKPANVAAAIGLVRPDAVDTASGVESSPGCKDVLLVRHFVDAVRLARR